MALETSPDITNSAAQRSALKRHQPLILRGSNGEEVLRIERNFRDRSGGEIYRKLSALVEKGFQLVAEEKEGKVTLSAVRPGTNSRFAITVQAPSRDSEGKRIFGVPGEWRSESGFGLVTMFNLLREVERENPKLLQQETPKALKPASLPPRNPKAILPSSPKKEAVSAPPVVSEKKTGAFELPCAVRDNCVEKK